MFFFGVWDTSWVLLTAAKRRFSGKSGIKKTNNASCDIESGAFCNYKKQYLLLPHILSRVVEEISYSSKK